MQGMRAMQEEYLGLANMPSVQVEADYVMAGLANAGVADSKRLLKDLQPLSSTGPTCHIQQIRGNGMGLRLNLEVERFGLGKLPPQP